MNHDNFHLNDTDVQNGDLYIKIADDDGHYVEFNTSVRGDDIVSISDAVTDDKDWLFAARQFAQMVVLDASKVGSVRRV